MSLQAGLIENRVQALFGSIELEISELETKQINKLLQRLKGVRLVGILLQEAVAKDQWPIVMHPVLSKFISPEAACNTMKPASYYVEITADTLMVLLMQKERLDDLVKQRSKIYSLFEKLTGEMKTERQVLFSKHGSESIRELINSKKKEYSDVLPVSNDVDLLTNENDFEVILKNCQKIGDGLEVICDSKRIPFVGFSFPVMCEHHKERSLVSFMGYRITFSALGFEGYPMPLLEVAINFSAGGKGCDKFYFYPMKILFMKV